jgi:hypothetical protein
MFKLKNLIVVWGLLFLFVTGDCAAQVGKTPEETWNNVIKLATKHPAKNAFNVICNHVEWNLMFEEIKEENEAFLIKQKIKSPAELKIYTQNAVAMIIDGSKGFARLLQNPFLYNLFLEGLKAAGNEDVRELEKANSQYTAEMNKGSGAISYGIDKMIADLDKPSNYFKFEVLNLVKNNKVAELQVLATDTRTGATQQMLFFFVKSGDKWHFRSYFPDELFKNFNTRIDSIDMQRVIRLARLLAKFA